MWQPGWEGSLGENGYMFMYGWVLCCPPEATTTLLIGYTPIKNKKLKKKQGRGWLFILPSQLKLSPQLWERRTCLISMKNISFLVSPRSHSYWLYWECNGWNTILVCDPPEGWGDMSTHPKEIHGIFFLRCWDLCVGRGGVYCLCPLSFELYFLSSLRQ